MKPEYPQQDAEKHKEFLRKQMNTAMVFENGKNSEIWKLFKDIVKAQMKIVSNDLTVMYDVSRVDNNTTKEHILMRIKGAVWNTLDYFSWLDEMVIKEGESARKSLDQIKLDEENEEKKDGRK